MGSCNACCNHQVVKVVFAQAQDTDVSTKDARKGVHRLSLVKTAEVSAENVSCLLYLNNFTSSRPSFYTDFIKSLLCL